MTLKGVCIGLVTIGALGSSSVAFAADSVRAGAAVPAVAPMGAHLPLRAVNAKHRKEHLQGEDAAAAGAGAGNWIVPALALAAIGGGVAAAVSNTDTTPDSP
jgi:hypothetical protein